MCCGFSPMIYLSDLLDYINIRILRPTHYNLDDSCSGSECAGWQRGEKKSDWNKDLATDNLGV